MNVFNALPYRLRFKLGFVSFLSGYIFCDDEGILRKLRGNGMTEIIRQLSASERRMLHFNFGRDIRNEFLLWHPKNPHTMSKLAELTEERQADSPYHPDNYSWAVISRLITEAATSGTWTSGDFDVSESLIYSLMSRSDDSTETLKSIGDALDVLVFNGRFDLLDDVFAETIQFNPSPLKLGVLLNSTAGHSTKITPVNYLRVAQRAIGYGIVIPDDVIQ